MASPNNYQPEAQGKLILRFDDITPGMAWRKFLPLKEKITRLGIRSVLGVVPECRDPSLKIESNRSDFFILVRQWMSSGDTIAQHGTYHVYDSEDSGLLGLQRRSEFAGHAYNTQFKRIAQGKEILKREGVWQPYFMAPSHSFDRNTLMALHELGFLAITDGFGFHPYRICNMVLVPQLTAHPIGVRLGLQTLCVHINGMSDADIDRLADFVERNATRFVDFKAAATHPVHHVLMPSLFRSATAVGVKTARSFRSVWRAITY